MRHFVKGGSKLLLLKILLAVLVLMLTMLAVPATLMADEPTVNLGTTETFAVLAHTGITNTGSTTIIGDVGVSDGTITDNGTLDITGNEHEGDATAIQAQTDLVTAYNDAASRDSTTLPGTQLGGLTLTPGVYDTGGVLEIGPANATLTLDAQGDPNAVFIFQSTATLVTAEGSRVELINGARFCRVFWVVPSSATLGVDSHFEGHIFAYANIQALSGATVNGQLLARTGEVTLNSNIITNDICDDIGNDDPADDDANGDNGNGENGETVVADTPPPDTLMEEEVIVDEFTITASTGSGGSIDPTGEVAVGEGADQTFIITPQGRDYEISDVLVDGESVGAVSSYTFENVQSNHTIYVDFGYITPVADPDSAVEMEPAITPVADPDPAVEMEPPIDELPYTGFDMMYYFMGFGALILAGAMMLVLKKQKKFRRYYPKHQLR